MIKSSDVLPIGFISKSRGLKGEVELQFTNDCFDTGSSDYLVLDMDGILIPFFWEEYRFKNDRTILLKFEGIDDDKTALHVVGREVYYPLQHIVADPSGALTSYQTLIGFHVTDAKGHEVGTITSVDDSTANVLLTLLTPVGQVLLLPYHDDFLLNYDLGQKHLALSLPEGILQVNS